MTTRAWIQVNEDRTSSVDTEGRVTYRARLLIASAYAVPPELFVLRTDTGEYSHVATVDDATDLGTDRQLARDEGRAFYRARDVSVSAVSRATLGATLTFIRRRLFEVVQAWDSASGAVTVPGSDLYVLEADA